MFQISNCSMHGTDTTQTPIRSIPGLWSLESDISERTELQLLLTNRCLLLFLPRPSQLSLIAQQAPFARPLCPAASLAATAAVPTTTALPAPVRITPNPLAPLARMRACARPPARRRACACLLAPVPASQQAHLCPPAGGTCARPPDCAPTTPGAPAMPSADAGTPAPPALPISSPRHA
jgi:hypothetical protein